MVRAPTDAVAITAMLGPTNTGKTHQALLRMLEHRTGMIGLPLRLLAREVYDRLTVQVGERAVALVTGEEKRVPDKPRYWVCTVEAMPTSLDVDFVAVDEIQLSAHPERGHIFTERLLYARGRLETWFLGSETIRPLLEQLVPGVRIKRHPRLSVLRGTPPVGLKKLPKRSAVVAFSAQRVYELAERLRHRYGGAALVLGALSPRTRNAQVALYQSGEVDYLVATDAIGMGLNLEISRVVFADLHKFDGQKTRPLELAEMAQIAGRAGRYLNDGNFSVLAPLPALSPAIVSALELHRFPNEPQLFYRNNTLDFSSLESLLWSLTAPSGRSELRSIQPAEDHRALVALTQRPEIRRRCRTSTDILLLWEVCQIPDYRQLLFELHVSLLEDVFLQLTGPQGKLKAPWIEEQIRRIERAEGDIETLMGKVSAIRTWNYVAQHQSWLDGGPELARRARDIEDRLSDSLHLALLARFVESKRTHSLPSPALPHSNARDPKPHPFAQLWAIANRQAAAKAPLCPNSEAAIDELVESAHECFTLEPSGLVRYRDRTLGTLAPGVDLLRPEVKVRLEPDPGKGARARIQRRLIAFTRDVVDRMLSPLRSRVTDQFSPVARGLVYQLEQGLGAVAIDSCRDQIDSLSLRDRQLLTSLGVRFGSHHVYFRRLLSDENLRLRVALASAYYQPAQSAPKDWTTSPLVILRGAQLPPGFATAVGFVANGPFHLRIDTHDWLIAELGRLAATGDFRIPRHVETRLQLSREALVALLESLGYRSRDNGRFGRGKSRPKRPSKLRQRTPVGAPQDSVAHSPADIAIESS